MDSTKEHDLKETGEVDNRVDYFTKRQDFASKNLNTCIYLKLTNQYGV